MKTLLKPMFLKIFFASGFFILASFLWRQYVISRISDTFPWGFPLQFYLAWGPCPPGEICYEFNRVWLAIDLAIWYLISAFLVNTLNRRKQTKKEPA